MKKITTETGQKITRKQAIKKAGITALTATSLLFLQTKAASATSSTGDTENSASRPGVNRERK